MSSFFKILLVCMLTLSIFLTVSCGASSSDSPDDGNKDPDSSLNDPSDNDDEKDPYDKDEENTDNGNKPSDKEEDNGNKPSDKEEDSGNKPSDKEEDNGNKPSDKEEDSNTPDVDNSDGKIDFSKLSREDFYYNISYYTAPSYSTVATRVDAYLGMKTAGLFTADILFEACFEYEGKVYTDGTMIITLNAAASSDTVSNTMNLSVFADEIKKTVDEYMGGDEASNIIESLIYESGLDYDHNAAESFVKKFDGMSAYEFVMNSCPEKIELGTVEELGFSFSDRALVSISSKRVGQGSSVLVFNEYLPIDAFDRTEIYLDADCYTDYENYEYESYHASFTLADYSDILRDKGITVNENGILIDEAFAKAFDEGIVISELINCPDGTVCPLENRLFVDFTEEKISYTLSIPEQIYAPLDFENGAVYSFDLDINGLTYPITYTTEKTTLKASDVATPYIPEFLKSYGELSRNVHATLSYLEPLNIVYVVDNLPVDNRIDKIKEYLSGGRFEFVYENFTTTLTKDSKECCGIKFEIIFDSFKEKTGDTYMWNYLPLSTLAVQDDYHTLGATVKLSTGYEAESVDVSAMLMLAPALCEAKASASPIKTSYYVGDEIVVNEGATLTLYTRYSFNSDSEKVEETIPFTKDMVLGLDTSTSTGDGIRYFTVSYDGIHVYNDFYTVKVDKVVSIDYNLGNFKYYILDVAPDYTQFSLTLNYESGKKVYGVPMREEYFVFETIPTTPGLHEITLNVDGCTLNVPIKVVQASAVEIISGIDEYYVLDSKPVSVAINVTFEPNEFGITEEYVELTESEIRNFNSTSLGEKTWTLKYGGVTADATYTVIEAAYIGYTISSDNSYVTIEGLYTDRKEITTAYYKLSNLGNFTVPAIIQGLPVRKIAERAFSDTNMFTKVIIPESVLEIGAYAFERIYSLKEVVFEGVRQIIPEGCFSGCEYLERVTFPTGLVALETYSFAYVGMKDFVIPKGVVDLGYGFIYDAKIERLAVPSSATESFKALSAMNLVYLKEFAYDGSYRLHESSALDDIIRNTLPAGFDKVYVYDTDKFVKGISYITYTAFEIYIDESVTTIAADISTITEATGTKYYCANDPSAILNTSGMTLTKATFDQWYE